MSGPAKNDRLIRFSVFELDRDSGELFKQGRKIKLQGQPFELLVALLDRPGEVLSREELRQKVWPTDTAGDFDHGLNRAVNKVREALGDAAETPRFIETLPRRGYRLLHRSRRSRPECLRRSTYLRLRGYRQTLLQRRRQLQTLPQESLDPQGTGSPGWRRQRP
jgi:DNA-binding winged helix-turn-helix (wHTH) protein